MTSGKMDKRCPRGLKDYPKRYCPLAVQRLKALRYAGKELTEEEESKLQGCPWAVSYQMSNYCFFKLMEDIASKQLSDAEIAHITNTSVATVKNVEKAALQKIRDDDSVGNIADMHKEDSVLGEFNRIE